MRNTPLLLLRNKALVFMTISEVIIGLVDCRSQIEAEYLISGEKKFYFNSCECGLQGVLTPQQPSPDEQTRRLRKREVVEEEENVFDILLNRRQKRDVNISINMAMDIDMGGGEEGEEPVITLSTDNKAKEKGSDKSKSKREGGGGTVSLPQVGSKSDQNLSKHHAEKPRTKVAPPRATDDPEESGSGGNTTDPRKKIRIINGVPANPGDAPWQVLLENMNNGEFCGGSIINRRFILTAAHCSEGFKKDGKTPHKFPHNILAIVRQPNRCSGSLLSDEYKVIINKVYDHPGYKRLPSQELVFDFALLRTKVDLAPFGPDLRPICLPPIEWWQNLFTDEWVVISGFGRTTREIIQGEDTTSCALMVARTQILEAGDSKCSVLSHSPNVQMCGWDERSDACSGDSGGPLTFFERGKWINQVLLGVVSYGSSVCAHKKASGVYGRVTKVMQWILSKIQIGECINERR